MVPMIYSLLLWKLNNEQAVRKKAYDRQAAKLEKNLKVFIKQELEANIQCKENLINLTMNFIIKKKVQLPIFKESYTTEVEN